jgi:hypothetical protein
VPRTARTDESDDRAEHKPREAYTRRDPRNSALFQVVERTLPAFLAQASEHGGVPGFVEDAFKDLLTCGVMEHGLCRFRCSACRCERLVALSCKAAVYVRAAAANA